MEITNHQNKKKLFDERKHLPMFELVLPFNLWKSIQTQYEFKYDLKWLCYSGSYIEDVYEYVSKTYTINISCFVKQNLFSINKKYKPASCILFPYLPPELWSLIVYYSRQPKICNVCGKYRKYY